MPEQMKWRETNLRCLNCGNQEVYTDETDLRVCITCRCGFRGGFVNVDDDLIASLDDLLGRLLRARGWRDDPECQPET